MPDDDDYDSDRGPGSARHGAARQIAERAMKAQLAGDDEEADRLFAEAALIDPEAVANVLTEQGDPEDDVDPPNGVQDDAEIAAMSRTVEPGSDAPSRAGIGRAGINGSGSGADDQGV